ncbi:LodA/GoxA family CTQ-dependent oxidase [Aureibacter tunicatorum]|uniref:L-lysine 6-oxidase n=1 Tax=Aureibacter tunicatorum TaxID=866807 RepID=A0AAE3XJZ9_9BACT|nr:LodA/GoxA family CTQ-dependent oxidase [Aureibacter tunicatorum]MDR6237383.1 hypothetical protein [Aureibacter tunicatorum]BDD06373.1 hypothetical protein AUTU_38560 [Aureibacter tunicatorum]
MSNNDIFRIHPAIGIARVGNSEEFYLGPETMAGMPAENSGDPSGGLPIKPETEDQTITSDDLRDNEGRLKRQAARFKIFAYDEAEVGSYPAKESREIKVGDTVTIGGVSRKVSSILWQVHLANKKANSWIEPHQGIEAYEPQDCSDRSPDIRNPKFDGTIPTEDLGDNLCCGSLDSLQSSDRLEKLVIDAGPHVVMASEQAISDSYLTKANFDNSSQNNFIENINFYCGDEGKIPAPVPVEYPKQFPNYQGANPPEHERIDSIGEMQTDKDGRLLVIGAYGKASGFNNDGTYNPDAPLNADVNNDNWFDDTADGPVEAVLIFEDGTAQKVQGSAWVITSDPAYAPQIPNIVNLWEDMYNTWVENFQLEPNLYNTKFGNTANDRINAEFVLGENYNPEYKPDFSQQIKPLLNGVNLQHWATNLLSTGVGQHKAVSELPMENPNWVGLMSFIRNPNLNNNSMPQDGTRMPLSLGDSEQDFLAISRTQYFFVYQWLIAGKVSDGMVLSSGEELDRNVLGNCLGGRFSPGIEMTFIVRDTNLYLDWNEAANQVGGPFRINQDQIDYKNLPSQGAVLGVGYMPLRDFKVQPGDICKFMSIPWHTDYNSCATHTPSPNAIGTNLTYWSWPAQRPVAVYNYEDVVCHEGLKFQRFSVRGDGTNAYFDPKTGEIQPYDQETVSARVGRFQDRRTFVGKSAETDKFNNWTKIGTIIQGSSIDQSEEDKGKVSDELLHTSYLEVASLFEEDGSNKVVPGPVPENHAVAPPEAMCPHASKWMNKEKK